MAGRATTQSHREQLLDRIRRRTAKVGVVGLGYVGLPLAETFAWGGYPVLGFDVDAEKVAKLKQGKSYIGHITSERVAELVGTGRFDATTDPHRFRDVDAIIICVPTPLTEAREPDLSYITGTGEAIQPHLRAGQLVVLESTTYPGTTTELLQPILERSGLRAGEDFFLAFSPEREDPGNKNFSTRTIPKVVGGINPASREVAVALYEPIVEGVIPVSSTSVAEACKILENTYRSINIALVNELKIVFSAMGIDVWEVIAAARTKPFGFQAFYPGPGLGGHCLAGSETVRIRSGALDTVLPLADLFERCAAAGTGVEVGGTTVVEPTDLETLSIDPETGQTGWKKVSHLFRRPYRGAMVEIRFAGNRVLRTTDRHPMLVVQDDRLIVREARELRPGDRVPQFAGLTSEGEPAAPCLDLLRVLPDHLIDRLHVRIHGTPWSAHECLLKRHYGWAIRDSICKDSLAARRYLELEPELGVSRERLILLSGRGAAHTQFPAVLRVTPDFCRLLGYFLSEGCISTEKGNPRVRLTFHREEADYIADVRTLLGTLGVRTSAFQDRTWQTTTIRAGSVVLGYLLRDVLGAGVNSGTMCVPAVVMGASPRHQEQLVAGLLRGDGDVYVHTGLRAYTKGERRYTHQFNSGTVGYFSSSPELLAQAETLLQGLGFSPARKKNKPHLRMTGAASLNRLGTLLGGAKGDRLERLTAAGVRPAVTRNARPWAGGQTLLVLSVAPCAGSEMVYSVEVPDTHTFATTGGVFVHNCIPIDPFYLTWAARKYGLNTRFIELAGEINTSMPQYVVERIGEALNEQRKPIKGSKIAVLGVAYKRDVDDPRESPAFTVMELLLRRGAVISYNDPHVPTLPRMRHHSLQMESQPLTEAYLAAQDAVVILTDHSAYDYGFIVRHAQLVVDTRNATRDVTGDRSKIWKA